jgi:hypothetical protein
MIEAQFTPMRLDMPRLGAEDDAVSYLPRPDPVVVEPQ